MLYGKRFLLGDVVVDSAHHTLTLPDGRDVRLEPRLIRLLTRLAAAKGDPVLRDDLLEEVSSLPYAGDEALTQGISKLRQALGDTAKAPRFIKTIPRRGYALVAPVAVPDDTAPLGNAPVPAETRAEVLPPVHGLGAQKNQSALTILAVAILVLSGLLVWAVLTPREIVRETELILDKDAEFIEKKDQDFIEKKDLEPTP